MAIRKKHNPPQDSPAQKESQFALKSKIKTLKTLLKHTQGEGNSFLF